MRKMIFGLLTVALIAFSAAYACTTPETKEDKAAKGGSASDANDSWITKPGQAKGQKAIFTDCRKNGRYEHQGSPIHKMGPSGGAGVKLNRSKSAPQINALKESTAQPLAAEAPAQDMAPAAERKTMEMDTDVGKEPQTPQAPEKKENSIYLSNDDSMSLSSAQRIIYAIRNFLPIPTEHLRPHEFLNFYKFEGAPVKEGHNFSVKATMAEGVKRNQSTLALSVRGKTITTIERRQAVMTFVIDQSGSMSSANKMDFLKKGMTQVYEQFKAGDVINIVQFNHEVCTPLEGFVVGRDDKALFDKAIEYLHPGGSTNLHDGMTKGYDLGEKYHEKKKNNRVIMITDAIANTGVVNEQLSSTITKFYDNKGIALSGIGVGHDFNDKMLNTLTEQGKGAYLFLSSEAAIDRVFGDKFISLLEVVARDVHFKLTLPDSLKMDIFYGEEASTKKEEVQAIHYFANSSQLFLSDLKGEPKEGDVIKLDIEYHDKETMKPETETFRFDALAIWKKQSPTIAKARLLMAFTDLIGETSPQTWRYWPCAVYKCHRIILPIPKPERRPPPHYNPIPDERAVKTCNYYTEKMSTLAKQAGDDAEVDFVMDLKERYCSRFEKAKKPVKRYGE